MLLGGLLLFGAENAWGHYLAHNGVLNVHSWTTGTDQMEESDGIYSLQFTNVATSEIQFKILPYADKWDDAIGIGDNVDPSTDISLYNKDGNFAFTLPVSTTITIYYNSNTEKVYVKVPTTYTVSLYLEASENYRVYSYSGEKNKFSGEWPGTISESPSSPYAYSIKVPAGFPLNVIINNGTNQSHHIDFGTISSNKSYSYNIGTDFIFDAISGSFNDWRNDYIFDESVNAVIIPLIASATPYTFKFAHYYRGASDDESTWAGSNVCNLTESGSIDLWSDNGSDAKLTADVTGDYLFVYKSWSGVTVSLDVYYPGASYSRTMAAEAWGTICLPYAVSTANVTAANMDFYSILGVDSKAAPTKLYLKEETELVAGKPYIFQATAADPSVTYGTTAAMVGSKNGLVGTYVATSIDGSNDDDKLYVITAAGGVQRAAASCNVGANKAYIKLNDVPEGNFLAPGVRVIEMNLGANDATNISSIEANEVAHKFIENGKLFIQKNGVVYDMTGRVVR